MFCPCIFLDMECTGTLIIVKPKSQVPKSRPKGLGLTLKSHGPPTPITFKHERVLIVKVAQNDPLDSPSKKINQVDR